MNFDDTSSFITMDLRAPTEAEITDHIIPALAFMKQRLKSIKLKRIEILAATFLAETVFVLFCLKMCDSSFWCQFFFCLMIVSPLIALAYRPICDLNMRIFVADYICNEIKAGRYAININSDNPFNIKMLNVFVSSWENSEVMTCVCAKPLGSEE